MDRCLAAEVRTGGQVILIAWSLGAEPLAQDLLHSVTKPEEQEDQEQEHAQQQCEKHQAN
jgi:hypothetical protein